MIPLGWYLGALGLPFGDLDALLGRFSASSAITYYSITFCSDRSFSKLPIARSRVGGLPKGLQFSCWFSIVLKL